MPVDAQASTGTPCTATWILNTLLVNTQHTCHKQQLLLRHSAQVRTPDTVPTDAQASKGYWTDIRMYSAGTPQLIHDTALDTRTPAAAPTFTAVLSAGAPLHTRCTGIVLYTAGTTSYCRDGIASVRVTRYTTRTEVR